MSGRPARVTLVEVGPRDGLQNEPAPISTADKIALIDALAAAGHARIEAGAFVSAKWVPQMADAEAVFAGITRKPGVRYSALVPNLAGLERAAAAGVTDIAVFAAASETFSRRNINASIADSLARYAEVAASALAGGMRVRGYVSTAFGCPFEGRVEPARVIDVTKALFAMGAEEVAISDTIGIAHPGQVRSLGAELASGLPTVERAALAMHFHDTRGTALVNVYAAMAEGISTFDCSAGGLGGCPYAPGAAGNLATEDLLFMLDGMAISTGVDRATVAAASRALESKLGHPLPSRLLQADHAARRSADNSKTPKD
ncbi:MAG: hydroxymethylglutaryl-CoA lyase [Acidobacteriota bacterium]|nr:hydroxymethylglutaryl-CoA lyase [Acidobacteriota bacterium]